MGAMLEQVLNESAHIQYFSVQNFISRQKLMSLLRRWFDPIRSSWFYKKPIRQETLPTEQGLHIYLRLDDVYS